MSAHLCTRSHYSLLNGVMSIEDLVFSAKEMGYKHLALTEKNVMYSTLSFYNACKKHGVAPIYGMEVQFETYASVLLAKNEKGLKALHRIAYLLSTKAFIELSDVLDEQENLIFIVYSEKGPFEEAMASNDSLAIQQILYDLKQSFNHLYIGISHQESKFFHAFNEKLIAIGKDMDVKSVALPKVYYKKAVDEESHRALRAIDAQKMLNDTTLSSEPGRYLLNKEEMTQLYDQTLLETVDEIIALCNVDLASIKTQLPNYNTGHDVSNDVYLSSLSKVGLSKRLNGNNDLYTKRLEFELEVINSMHFYDYFLIVYDLVRYAKNKGILVGPGRGSAAGSLVAYSLGITDVDPIEYGLLFERFLNPERITMPDIDIDFPDDRRDEVIAYANMKYGKEHVAHILAFGSMQAKQSLRDCGRILGIPISKINTASKMIGNSTLYESYQKNKRFANLIKNDKAMQKCFDLALKLEGTPRHTTLHPAGLVLSDKPILEVAPMSIIDDYSNSLQYDMTYIEDLGLIKIDLLVLKNLTTIDSIVKRIRKQDVDFRIQSIPLDDQKTFALLAQGQTTGIFQLESKGMTDLLVKMRPSRFLDIVDTIALYRPGPMENIPLYLTNRFNTATIKYVHEDLEAITKDTFGILIYQEQIMQAAQMFGNFSLGKADILRRAMSKKDASILKSLEADFISGSKVKGYSEAVAKEVFDLIYKFANYGFNKSHSVAYGLIAYQLAYLKANYPQLFYNELLTSVISDANKTKIYIEEGKRSNVLMLPLNIDQSSNVYELEHHKIRLPLTIIKGISQNVTNTIMREREEYGPFTSFIDALVRFHACGITAKQTESLIDAGALDYFGLSREVMIASMERIKMYASLIVSKEDKNGRNINYGLISEPELVVVKNDKSARLEKEFTALGFYLSDHPIMQLRDKHGTTAIGDLKVADASYRIIASVSRLRLHRDKNGAEMAFISIEDDTGSYDAVVFSSIFASVKDLVSNGSILLVMGTIKEEGSLVVRKIHVMEKE